MNNFCQDCGKRNSFDLIHTCTPPSQRPQNCGTSYCSCIECPYPAPVAGRIPEAGQAMAVDAARYRWLKAHHDADFCFAIVKNPHFDCYESGELDAAIDAAMKEPK